MATAEEAAQLLMSRMEAAGAKQKQKKWEVVAVSVGVQLELVVAVADQQLVVNVGHVAPVAFGRLIQIVHAVAVGVDQ